MSATKMKGSMSFIMTLLLIQSANIASAEPVVLDGINVTAPSVSKRDDLDPESITNPYRVESSASFGTEIFTRKEIAAYAPKDLFDLLNKAAGMNLTYQGRRSPFSLDQRGGGQLTYILDGAVLPSSSSRILQKIPLQDIEEIQIVRGATSLALGPTRTPGQWGTTSGVNTGFIVIRTKHPQKTEGVVSAYTEKSGSLPFATGENLYAGTRFGTAASSLRGYVAGGAAAYDRSSNDRWFDGQNGQSGMINAGVTVGKLSVDATGYTDTGRLEMQRGVTYSGALAPDKWYYDPLTTSLLSSTVTMAWNRDQVTILSLFKTRYEQEEHNESFANAMVSLRNYSEESSGYSIRHNAQFGNTLVQLGWQINNSNGFGPNLSNPYNNFDTTVKGWSCSVEQKLFDGALSLDGGYRRDLTHSDVSSTVAAKPLANHDVDMEAAQVVALGARWKMNELLALNARYFHGDEGTPSDFTMTTQSGAPLHAEKQKRFELALEAAPASYFKPMLTWFSYDIDNQKSVLAMGNNVLQTYTVNGETYYYYTEADVLRRGIELAVKGDVRQSTSYSFSWTHLTTNSTTTNGVTTDGVGVSTPENYFSALLSHSWEKYRANLSIKQVSSWQTSASPVGIQNADLGEYTTVDANIMRTFTFSGSRLTATLYGHNLGDVHYSTRYVTGYYPDRGRTLGLELSMAF
ncbi:TonB-dependent receptor plug domain-containing protein [Pelodictyon phaeoclathratiforme]|jgi:iron complex outermembrane receptor protein|uniref:TonB-dependent receptor plug n=1 Tax=Pelodictyon phaeoclathratiforme (strain DSM 5477 / BU-1) TaxID=324925 RepID=B4SCJ9_PELPB|nr:TonB-dependent receptor plug domain-containing protein [Pelodictyon phaeoclathratiforme]ACF44204.1 TonB-dependent receptor plug [Pelodictyon phaeoclathratiforme BU-1]MBV5288570.1 TonB-dependent receptor plug domain-containing protein [Pelodictyon phaeoclathratiforme]